MSLLQDKAIELLPSNKFSIAPAMRQAGYAASTAYRGGKGSPRERVREGAKKYFDAELVKREYKRVLKETKQSRKHALQLKCLDSMARCEGMFTDNTNIKANITDEDKDILKQYGLIRPSVSNSISSHGDNGHSQGDNGEGIS